MQNKMETYADIYTCLGSTEPSSYPPGRNVVADDKLEQAAEL